MTLKTLMVIIPIITIIIMFSKSLYTSHKNSTITIIFCSISIIILLNTKLEIASAIIGLLFLLDVVILENNYSADDSICGEDKDFLYNSKIIRSGLGLLICINLYSLTVGISNSITTPVSKITEDNILNHLIIDKRGISYKKQESNQDITNNIDMQITYERKYRQLRTMHCDDTDLKCMEQKIKGFNQ